MAESLRVSEVPGKTMVRYCRRNYPLGMGALVVASYYGYTAVGSLSSLFGSPSLAGLWSLGWGVLATLVFGRWALEFSLVERRLVVGDHELVYRPLWPLPVVARRIDRPTVTRVVITTLGSHLSKRGFIAVTLYHGRNRCWAINLPLPRRDIDWGVEELSRVLGTLTSDLTVVHDGVLSTTP